MTQDHRNGDDKIEIHYRLQLSALMDGGLPPDEARFLLRRLQHDTELGDCWERWQMAGETLRGRVVAPLPADFSQRVAALIAAEPVPTAASKQMPRWTRWGGGALAASVALLALFMTRQQSPVDTLPDSGQPTTQIVAASSAAPSQIPQPVAPAQPAVDPNAAGALAATAVAVAEVPRRAANRRAASSRSQNQRAALRAASRASDADLPIAVAANAPASANTGTTSVFANASAPTAVASNDPFASQPIAPSRPWPSATLPQFSTSGALSVDYGPANSYYPFQPRPPASSPSEGTDAGVQETPQR